MNPSPSPESNTDKTKTITIEIHGLRAKIQLNRPEEDLIPAHYLQKAQQTRTSLSYFALPLSKQ